MVTAQLFQYVDGEKRLLLQIGPDIREIGQIVETEASVIIEAGEKVEGAEGDSEDPLQISDTHLMRMLLGKCSSCNFHASRPSEQGAGI